MAADASMFPAISSAMDGLEENLIDEEPEVEEEEIDGDEDYDAFEDILLNQNLNNEDIQRIYVKHRRELIASGLILPQLKESEVKKPRVGRKGFKAFYDAYGPPDKWKNKEDDIFRHERIPIPETKVDVISTDNTDSDAEYDTDLDDFVYKDIDSYDPVYLYKGACRRFDLVPCTAVNSNLRRSRVRLNHQGLGSQQIKALSVGLVYHSSLTHLKLSDNCLGVDGVRHLAAALRLHPTITCLDVSFNELGSQGASVVCDLVIVNHNIKTLTLQGNGFRERDASYFTRTLQSSHLKHLDLSHNEFREEGGKILGSSISCNKSLETLKLGWNHLRLQGAIAIAFGLSQNVALRELNLAWNGFATEGAICLGQALKVNQNLRILDLTSNRVGLEGVVKISEALCHNPYLKILKLSKNPITTAGACHILNVLKCCTQCKLTNLELLGVEINEQFEMLLEEVLSVRRIEVIHGGQIRQGNSLLRGRKKHAVPGDPLSLLMGYVKKNSLRLFDLFAQLDKDNSMTVSRQEFKRGMKAIKVPLTDMQIDQLVVQLDVDGDGEISFGEFLEGQKIYRARQRRRKEGALSKIISVSSIMVGNHDRTPSTVGRDNPAASTNPSFMTSRAKTMVNMSRNLGNDSLFGFPSSSSSQEDPSKKASETGHDIMLPSASLMTPRSLTR